MACRPILVEHGRTYGCKFRGQVAYQVYPPYVPDSCSQTKALFTPQPQVLHAAGSNPTQDTARRVSGTVGTAHHRSASFTTLAHDRLLPVPTTLKSLLPIIPKFQLPDREGGVVMQSLLQYSPSGASTMPMVGEILGQDAYAVTLL